MQDYPAFFRDIGFPQGRDMMDSILGGFVSLSHPGVATVCVGSRGVDTPGKLVYQVTAVFLCAKIFYYNYTFTQNITLEA